MYCLEMRTGKGLAHRRREQSAWTVLASGSDVEDWSHFIWAQHVLSVWQVQVLLFVTSYFSVSLQLTDPVDVDVQDLQGWPLEQELSVKCGSGNAD